MDDLFAETFDLQRVWSAKNTLEMHRRGVIIRTEIPERIRNHVETIAAETGTTVSDLGVEGRDGTGLKTEIPWVRVFSRSAAPRATTGWYVVYLFSASGDRVYLSLNQGTTTWTGKDFAPRKLTEIKARVAWARPLVAALLAERDDLHESIELGALRSQLGPGYEAGNVTAIEYRRGSLPSEATLIEDLLYMSRLLGEIYRGEQRASYVPGDTPPEVIEAEEASAKAARRRKVRSKGQGIRLNAEERRILEQHSVNMATKYFRDQGWSVKDVGAKESYDLFLKRDGQRLHVEVKGTTSTGAQVVLTRPEVETQRKLGPANALVVVHSIHLDRASTPPVASGGILCCTSPWYIEEEDLTVVSYVYKTGL
ncbi:MrcB family domain-containing protein [Actinomadura rayongensis]